jgi:hypothetical protein
MRAARPPTTPLIIEFFEEDECEVAEIGWLPVEDEGVGGGADLVDMDECMEWVDDVGGESEGIDD